VVDRAEAPGLAKPTMALDGAGSILVTSFHWSPAPGEGAQYIASLVQESGVSQRVVLSEREALRPGWHGEYEGIASDGSTFYSVWASRATEDAPGDLLFAIMASP
jgi:hypothetical protein